MIVGIGCKSSSSAPQYCGPQTYGLGHTEDDLDVNRVAKQLIILILREAHELPNATNNGLAFHGTAHGHNDLKESPSSMKWRPVHEKSEPTHECQSNVASRRNKSHGDRDAHSRMQPRKKSEAAETSTVRFADRFPQQCEEGPDSSSGF